MKITQEEVTHVANLSKLKFSPEETAEFATTLSKIVDMVELLEEVDTTDVDPQAFNKPSKRKVGRNARVGRGNKGVGEYTPNWK